MTIAAPIRTARPRLRGVSHEIAFYVSLGSGPALVVLAPTAYARLDVALYAATLTGLFGVSALLHRRTWSEAPRRWLRRLDHAMIFLVVAGTYTAIGGLTLGPATAGPLLRVVWLGAMGGVLLDLAWVDAPKWLRAIPYVAIGWVAVGALPQLREGLGTAGLGLLVAGGALYRPARSCTPGAVPIHFPPSSATTRSFTGWWSWPPRRITPRSPRSSCRACPAASGGWPRWTEAGEQGPSSRASTSSGRPNSHAISSPMSAAGFR